MLTPERTPLLSVFEDDVIGTLAIVRAGNVSGRVLKNFTAASFPPTPRNVVEGINQHDAHRSVESRGWLLMPLDRSTLLTH